jgi:hypothetical protein
MSVNFPEVMKFYKIDPRCFPPTVPDAGLLSLPHVFSENAKSEDFQSGFFFKSQKSILTGNCFFQITKSILTGNCFFRSHEGEQ